MRAVIKVDSIITREASWLKFRDASQKTWNCNKPDLIPHFEIGERYVIDYNETQPTGGRKYGSKYINRARFWKPEDGENTWPDKEPWTGGNSGFSGRKDMRKDFDPEVSKRQTAANVAGNILANMKDITFQTIVDEFEPLAQMVYEFISGAKDSEPKDSGTKDDEDFGF